jgi:iron(III) transport system ATP-binding protein
MATQLSGGQQQRLSLARAIVREPKVLLLDEPLSNLDAKLRERMRGELSVIQRRLGVTTLFVTHDQIEALSMSDAIAVMDSGRIVQEGPPQEIYHSPANEFVASFIGSTNLFAGEVESVGATTPGCARVSLEFGSVECEVPAGIGAGSRVIVAIRPEDIIVRRDGEGASATPGGVNVFDGRVGIGLFTGNAVEYYLDIGDALVQARAGSRDALRRGDPVRVEIPPQATRTFVLEGEPKVRLGSQRLARLARLDDDGRN